MGLLQILAIMAKGKNSSGHQKNRDKTIPPFYLLAIGASAGGLEALKDFLIHYPENLKNTAILVAQHVNPTHKSMLVQLLSKDTPLIVEEAADGHLLRPGKLYITPPNANIAIRNGAIQLTDPGKAIVPKPSVDMLFSSVASEFKTKAIGIILSGTGTDGSNGLLDIVQEGGMVIVQDPATARFDGMPVAAIKTGQVDLVMPTAQMGTEIAKYIGRRPRKNKAATEELQDAQAWSAILNLLTKHTGTNFAHYKMSTVLRRLSKRLAQLKISSPQNYMQYIEQHPAELDELFSLLLINVTSFFRDQESFTATEKLMENLIRIKQPGETLRIWVVACATGEEAYSIAILLTEILARQNHSLAVQIFATDIDEEALRFARKAIYPETELKNLPPELVGKYFIQKADGFEVIKDIRSMVLFSRHDVTSNPPFLKLDLLSCRNLLIYFDKTLQQKVIPLFHYALQPGSYLLLGKSESIAGFTDLFSVVDARNKIFLRKTGAPNKQLSFVSPLAAIAKKHPPAAFRSKNEDASIKELVKETLFNTFENPCVVINEHGDIQEVYGDARLYLSFREGVVSSSILRLVNTDMQLELYALLRRCVRDQQQIRSGIRKFMLFDSEHLVRMAVCPVIGHAAGENLYIVIFERIEKSDLLYEGSREDLNDKDQALIAELEKELADTRQNLQTYIEEMESANEELQSLNEELQSTNEELQSTNEELETTNEELQSANEEVQITYSQLKTAYQELEKKEEKISLNEANLRALLSNTLQIFYLVDPSYKIIAFNNKAANALREVYRRELKIGDSVIDLIASPNMDQFLKDFKRAMAGEIIIGERSVVDDKGNFFWYQYNYTPVITQSGEVTGVSMSMLDTTESKKLQAELQTTEKLLASVFNATSIGIAVTDELGNIVDVNTEFANLYGYERTELIGQSHLMLVSGKDRKLATSVHQDFIQGTVAETGMELEAVKKDGTVFDIYTSSAILEQSDGRRYEVKSVRDITVEKKVNRIIEASQIKYRAIVDNSMHAFFLTKPDGTILEANKAACDLFGYTEEELKRIGRNGFIDPGDPALGKYIQERKERGYVNGQLTAIKKSGERIVCEFSSVVFTDINGEERTSTMMMDITQRRKLEKLLEETNQLAKVGGWELDLEHNKLYWSPVVKQIHETDPDFEPALETAILFYKEGESRDKIIRAVEKGSVTGEPWQLDLQIITAKGNERWVRASGKPEFKGDQLVRLYGSFQDIHDQKLADLELERSRQEYKSLYTHHPDGVFSLDLAGNFLDSNETTLAIGEISKEELLQLNYLQLLPIEEVARVSGYFGLVKRGLPQDYETQIVSASGATKFIRVTNVPIMLNNTVTGVYGIIRDISAYKKYEDDLKFQSRLLNTIQQSVIVTRPDGQIMYWNKFAEQLYGWKPEEVLGRNIVEITPSALSMEAAIDIMAKLAAGESWAGEFLVRNKLNQPFKVQIHNSPIVDADGKLTGIIGVSWDITKEQEAREYIKFQANLLDSVEQAVIASDLEGVIFYWNHHAEKVYGWTKEEAIGENVRILQSGNPHYERMGEELMAEFRKGNSWSGEFEVRNRNGAAFPIFSVNSPVYDKSGNLVGVIAVSYDITERKNAEMVKEFERLDKEALINTTDDLIWSVNRDYHLIAANRAFVDAVKTRTGKVIRRGDLLLDEEYYPEDYLQFWKQQYDRGLAGESFTFEIHISSLHGEPEVWTETTINPIKDNDSIIGLACYGRDVSETRRNEMAIRLSEERFRIMFTQAPMGIALIDSLTGHILDLNDQFAQIAGRSKDALRQMDWMQITHPDDVQADLNNMQLLNEKRIPGFTMAKRYIKSDGSIAWVQMSIAPVETDDPYRPRHLCMIEDITARMLSEESIRISNERYNLVAKATNDAIWDWNVLTGRVDRAGAGMQTLFGYDPREDNHEYNFWRDRVHPDDLPEVQARREAVLQSDSSFWEAEYRFRRKDGSYAFVNDKGYIMRDEEGRATRMIGAMQDITDRKKSELMLRDLNQMLEKRAGELEFSNTELERFAFVASHDLQEPLRMVSSFLQLLEKKYGDNLDETAHRYIQFAVDGAARMKRLILDLLEYSRAGTNNDVVGDTDMNLVLEEVSSNLKVKLDELHGVIRYEHLPVLSNTRRTQMVQLMQNIIGNSLKYHSNRQPEIVVEAREDTDSWIFSVKDNGIGFDMKFAEKIFVIFQRLHNNSEYSGTGIGLSICKKIVERYGGRIWVESLPGEGSIFYFSISKQN